MSFTPETYETTRGELGSHFNQLEVGSRYGMGSVVSKGVDELMVCYSKSPTHCPDCTVQCPFNTSSKK